MNTFQLFLSITFVIFTVSAQTEEDLKLRRLIGSLCNVNKLYNFGGCCESYYNGASVTVDNYPTCFGKVSTSSSSITTLEFEEKGLTNIPVGVFSSLSDMKTLSLPGNSLTQLVSGTFEGLSRLESLDLGDNPLAYIQPGSFKGLNQLSELKISSECLIKLFSGTFEGLNSISSLDIGLCGISEIESGTFKGLNNVEFLSVETNHLTKLVTGTFEGLNKLESLYLGGNSIAYIEENVFGANTKIPSQLMLENNNLITLPSSFSSATTALPSVIDVSDNCLDCSLFPYIKSDNCKNQGNSHCPSSNLCNGLDKFQKDHCFMCNTTNNNAFCDICMPGYKHTGSGCGCVKCEEGDKCEFGTVRNPDSCVSCTNSLPTTCENCAKGFKYDNGNCNVCGEHECCVGGKNNNPSFTNCSICSDDQTTCTKCIDGYELKDNACQPKSSGSVMNKGTSILLCLVVLFIGFMGSF